MEMKHTPGPWHIVPTTLGSIEADPGIPIGMASQTRPYTTRVPEHGERMANARLMAAAPEMLEALLLFVEYESASESSDDVAMMIAYAEFKRAAHSAIAAATGE